MKALARLRAKPAWCWTGLLLSCSLAVASQDQALALNAAEARAAASPRGAPPQQGPLPGAVLAGHGLLRFWGLEVYHASLWVWPGFRPEAFADHPFALELEYRRAFKADAIAERSIQEMRRLGVFSEAQARRWQRALQAALPDVRPGDRIVGLNRPGQGVRFEQDGRLLGELADPEFARLFFAIWLAPASPEPALREALLAGLAAD